MTQLDYATIQPANQVSWGANKGTTSSATAALILNVINLCEISSGYYLGRLVGLPFPHSACRWFAGEHQPSYFNFARVLYLAELKLTGIDFRKVQDIDWETGQPVYYPRVGERVEETGLISWKR